MRKHRHDCLNLCMDAGLTVLGVDVRGRHLKVRCVEGFLTFPCTPSDRRWRLNMRAQARRLAWAR